MKKWYLLVVFTLVLAPAAARADVSFLLLEAIGVAGEFSGSGHTAIYLSNICTDDGVSLRPCRDSESGVVLSSYPKFGNGSNYEWMAVPLLAYLYGVENQNDIPIYANGKIRDFLRERYRRKHLSSIIPAVKNGALPEGSWKIMLTTGFNRDVYGFTVDTTREEDIKFLRETNSRSNSGKFNSFTNNCADFARRTLNRYFPGATRRDWINDFGVTTPKAIARSFYKYAKKHPERELSISRFPQIHGPIWRSFDNRNFTEMAFRSKKYLIPSVIFKTSLVAIFSGTYLLTGRFDAHKTYVNRVGTKVARIENDVKPVQPGGLMYFVASSRFADRDQDLKFSNDTLLADKKVWKSHKTAFAPILREAITQRLFRDVGEVKSFFRDLEHQSEPAFDQNGQLILKVKAYGRNRILGITRQNLLDETSDRELALKLILARIYTDLNAKEKDRSHYYDFWADWLTMQQIMREEAPMLASIDKGRGKFAGNRQPAGPKKQLKKFMIAVTH